MERTSFNVRLATLLMAGFLLAFVNTGVLAAAGGGAVVMVTDLQGKSALETDPRGPVSITATLAAGARVRLDANAKLTALHLATGDEYLFNGPALILFRAGEPVALSGPNPKKVTHVRDKSVRLDPTRLVQPALVLRDMQPMKLVGPSGALMPNASPEFRWQPLHPEALYSFELTDDAGTKIYETQVRSTTVKLPDARVLKAGAAYVWEVSAQQPNGTKLARKERFRMATPELYAELTALRPASDASLSERIAFAAWLEQAGFRDEARKYWQTASAERPEDEVLKRFAGLSNR